MCRNHHAEQCRVHAIDRPAVLVHPQRDRIQRQQGVDRQRQQAGLDQPPQGSWIRGLHLPVLEHGIGEADQHQGQRHQQRRRRPCFPERLQSGERQAQHEQQGDEGHQRQQALEHREHHLPQDLQRPVLGSGHQHAEPGHRAGGEVDEGVLAEQLAKEFELHQREQLAPQQQHRPAQAHERQHQQGRQPVLPGVLEQFRIRCTPSPMNQAQLQVRQGHKQTQRHRESERSQHRAAVEPRRAARVPGGPGCQRGINHREAQALGPETMIVEAAHAQNHHRGHRQHQRVPKHAATQMPERPPALFEAGLRQIQGKPLQQGHQHDEGVHRSLIVRHDGRIGSRL